MGLYSCLEGLVAKAFSAGNKVDGRTMKAAVVLRESVDMTTSNRRAAWVAMQENLIMIVQE